MKTTLFSIAALAGLACLPWASGAETLSLLSIAPLVGEDSTTTITCVGNSATQPSGWSTSIGTTSDNAADILKSCLAAGSSLGGVGLGTSSGWQAFDGQLHNSSLGSERIESTVDSFQFLGRGKYGAGCMLCTVKLDSLTEGQTITDLTISGTSGGANFNAYLFTLDGALESGTMTLLASTSAVGSFSLSNPTSGSLSLTSEDTVYVLFSSTSTSAAVDSQLTTVSGLNMTATLGSVPEPVSAVLLLPCVLGMAVRRRRSISCAL